MTYAIVLLLIRPTRVLPHGLGDDLLDMYRTFAGDPVTESADITAHIARGVASCAAINTAELFSKTNNYHEGHTSSIGWSGAWFVGALKALGTKTVRISAGTNRSNGVCGFAAFRAVDGHCSAAAVLA